MTLENSLEIALPPQQDNIHLCALQALISLSQKSLGCRGVPAVMIHHPHKSQLVLYFQKHRIILSVHYVNL